MAAKRGPFSPEIDEKDQEIIKCVIRDPQAEIDDLARETTFPPSTVSKRISQLQRTERIGRGFRILDWKKVGYPFRYRVDVKVNQRKLALGDGGPAQGPPVPGTVHANFTIEGRPVEVRFSQEQPKSKVRPAELPPLPPQPEKDIYTQQELASYIKNVLGQSPAYTHQLVVESVTILLGGPDADLSILVRAKEPEIILSFVTDGLRVLGGVQSTTTSQEAWSC
jgi:DNA-binding Lrp family transcriptional regulator